MDLLALVVGIVVGGVGLLAFHTVTGYARERRHVSRLEVLRTLLQRPP